MKATASDHGPGASSSQWPGHYPFRTALQQAEAARLGMSFESYSRHSAPEIFELLRALDRREAQPERQEAQARAKGAAPNIGRELQEQFAQEQAELAGKGQKGVRPSGRKGVKGQSKGLAIPPPLRADPYALRPRNPLRRPDCLEHDIPFRKRRKDERLHFRGRRGRSRPNL